MMTRCRAGDGSGLAPANRRSERRRAIIAAAEALFLEQGYDSTSLAAIVKQSGGSLATLYELFGNKQGLLHAIVEAFTEDDVCPVYAGCEDQAPAQLVRQYAHRLYAHFTSPRAVALKRIAITEAMRDPAFASSLYQGVHLPAVKELAENFAGLNETGRAVIDDPLAAAELFFAIVISDARLRVLAQGDAGHLDEAALDWRLAPFLSFFKFR